MASNDMDILKMQEEAIKRVNEMRKKADYYVNSSNFANEKREQKETFNEEHKETEQSAENKANNTGDINGVFGNLFDNLSEDNIVIIVLILVLSHEGADQLLIFALLYLLL